MGPMGVSYVMGSPFITIGFNTYVMLVHDVEFFLVIALFREATYMIYMGFK